MSLVGGLDVLQDGALDTFLDSYFRLRPVNATFTGAHAYDDHLPDWSLGGLEAAADGMRRLRAELSEPGAPESARDLLRAPGTMDDIDQWLARSFLDIQLAEYEGSHFQRGNPSLWIGEATFGVIALMVRDFAPADDRIQLATERLAAIPSFLQAMPSVIQQPIPAEWVERARAECTGARVLFGDGLDMWLLAAEPELGHSLPFRRAAAEAYTAMREADAWLASVPTATARRSCGAEMLELLLDRGHACVRPLLELAREARARFDEAAADLDDATRPHGGWAGVQQQLASDHPVARNYYTAYERTWEASRAAAVEASLATWPQGADGVIRFVPIPVETRSAAPFLYYLNYRSPAPLDLPTVHEYAVPPIDRRMSDEEIEGQLRANNHAVIKLNHVVHHGGIGHHVQNGHARKASSRIGRLAAVDCASRIGMFAGGTMAEGWACYATDLMDEIGFFTPLERVSEAHTRARMLARALVDLGFHGGTMSEEECVALYADRLGMSPAAAHAQVTRTSMFPGTAVMYWLGTRGLHDLRAAVQAARGAHFDLRQFHDRVLSFGSIPVPIVAALVNGNPA